jgi:hypothetical protein
MTPQVKAKVAARARELGVVVGDLDRPSGACWAKRPGANRDTEIAPDAHARDADPVRHRGH